MDVSRYTLGAKALFSFFVIFAILATGCCCCAVIDFRTDPDYYKLDDANEKQVVKWKSVIFPFVALAAVAVLVLSSILCAMFLPTLETVPTADLEVASQPHLARYISMDVNQYTPEAKALFSFFVISAILAMGFCCYAGIDFRRDDVYYEKIDKTSTEEKKRGDIKWDMVRKYLKKSLAITAVLVLSSSLCFSYLPTKDGRAFRPKTLTESSEPQLLSEVSMDTENFTDGAQALFGCFIIALVLAVASGGFACRRFCQISSRIADQTTAQPDIDESISGFKFYFCAFLGFTVAFSLCLVFLPTHSKETVSSSSPGPALPFPDDLLHDPYFGGICKISHQQARAAIGWFIDEDCVEGFGLLGSNQPFHRSTLFVPDQLFRNSSNSSMYCQQTMSLANNPIASLANGNVTVCADICRLVSFIDRYQEQNSITGILMTFGVTHVVVMLSCVAFIPAPTNQVGRIAFLAWVACILTQGMVVVVALASFIRAAEGVDKEPFGSCLVDWNPQWKVFHMFSLAAGVFQPFVIANLSILSLYSGLLVMAYRVWEYANVIQHDGDAPPENIQQVYPEDIWPVLTLVFVGQKKSKEAKNIAAKAKEFIALFYQPSVWFAFLFYHAVMVPARSVIFLGKACIRFGGSIVYRRAEERMKKSICYLQHCEFLVGNLRRSLKQVNTALTPKEFEIALKKKNTNNADQLWSKKLKEEYPEAKQKLFASAYSKTCDLLTKIKKCIKIQAPDAAAVAALTAAGAGAGAAKTAVTGEEMEGKIHQIVQDLKDLMEKIQELEPEDVIKTLKGWQLECKAKDSKDDNHRRAYKRWGQQNALKALPQMQVVYNISESMKGIESYRKRIGYHDLHSLFFIFIKQLNGQNPIKRLKEETKQLTDLRAWFETKEQEIEDASLKRTKSFRSMGKSKKAKDAQESPIERAYTDARNYIKNTDSSRDLALNRHFNDAALTNLGFDEMEKTTLRGLKRHFNKDFSENHFRYFNKDLLVLPRERGDGREGREVQIRARYTRKNDKSGMATASHFYRATMDHFDFDESGKVQVTFSAKGRRVGFWEERTDFEIEKAVVADDCLELTDAVGSRWFAPLFLIGVVVGLPSLPFSFVFLPQLLAPCVIILLVVAGLAHFHTQILNRGSTADEDVGEANDKQDVDDEENDEKNEEENEEEDDPFSAREVNNKLLAMTLPYHSFWAMHFQPLYDLEQKRKLREQDKRWEDEKDTLHKEENNTGELENCIGHKVGEVGMIAWCKFDTRKSKKKHQILYQDMEQLLKDAKIKAVELQKGRWEDNRFAFAFQMPTRASLRKDKNVTVHFFDIANLKRWRDRDWCTCIGKVVRCCCCWHLFFLHSAPCLC
jgi:hypothetical protein